MKRSPLTYSGLTFAALLTMQSAAFGNQTQSTNEIEIEAAKLLLGSQCDEDKTKPVPTILPAQDPQTDNVCTAVEIGSDETLQCANQLFA